MTSRRICMCRWFHPFYLYTHQCRLSNRTQSAPFLCTTSLLSSQSQTTSCCSHPSLRTRRCCPQCCLRPWAHCLSCTPSPTSPASCTALSWTSSPSRLRLQVRDIHSFGHTVMSLLQVLQCCCGPSMSPLLLGTEQQKADGHPIRSAPPD